MNNTLFKRFLKEAQVNDRVSWDIYDDSPYIEIINQIYADVSRFKNYTLDGRFQDILVDLLKDPKYETEGYAGLLRDLETELNKLVVTNIMLLPLNFIDSDQLGGDVELNQYMNIFLPTKYDLKNYSDFDLSIRQQKKRKDSSGRMSDDLCNFFGRELNEKLDKEHILLVKDRNFFHYPILSILLKNIDYKVEKESGKIAQAVYSLLRIIDFREEKDPYSWGIMKSKWISPAFSYVVYYNYKDSNRFNPSNGYGGSSFLFNFSKMLDINTLSLSDNLELFTNILDLYIKIRFMDIRKYNDKQLKFLSLWSNAISMFNTAYELASIENYDACNLILCALLESLFLKNEGRNKQQRLLSEISEYIEDIYDDSDKDKLLTALKSIYHFRNKIMHEGIGYEAMYKETRSLTDYQGDYRGMRPFSYNGSVELEDDVLYIESVLQFVAEFLICDKTLEKVKSNLIER